jgi:hypothetical protein
LSWFFLIDAGGLGYRPASHPLRAALLSTGTRRSGIVAESWLEKAEDCARHRLLVEVVLHVQNNSSAVLSVFSPISLLIHHVYQTLLRPLHPQLSRFYLCWRERIV